MNSSSKKPHVLLVIAVILAIAIMQMPKTCAAEASFPEKDSANKVISFMTDVAGLDMDKYNAQVQVSNFSGNQRFDTIVKYNLTSAESKLDVISLLRNNTVVWCKLYPIKGSPLFALASPTNELSAARCVLDRLQTLQTTSYLPEMRNLLDTISSQANTTTTRDNVEQKISFGADSEDIRWSYDTNGIENYYKMVALSLKNNCFEFFCDNWNLYTIGNADIRVSEMQAVQIAKQGAIERYSVSGNDTSADFIILDQNAMATLTMQDRGSFTLYPHWEILLPLDKAYGAVTCIRVLVWADTGQIAFMAAVGNGGVPQNSQDPTAVSSMISAMPVSAEQGYFIIGALIAATISFLGYFFIRQRK